MPPEENEKLRTSQRFDFLSLPSHLRSDILGTFCEAQDVMALALTCKTLLKDVQPFLLTIESRRFHLPQEWKIPIFFPELCHSVFVSWELQRPRRHDAHHHLVLFSRPRKKEEEEEEDCDPNASQNVIIWRKTKKIVRGETLLLRTSFYTDPSQEYFLFLELHRDWDFADWVGTVHKQFMVSPLGPARKGALTSCLAMGCITCYIWQFKDSVLPKQQQRDALSFFTTLFILGFKSVSTTTTTTTTAQGPSSSLSSPALATFFDSLCDDLLVADSRQVVQEQMVHILEQVLEQREPRHCVTLREEAWIPPPSLEESPIYGMDLYSCSYSSPFLLLTEEFVWKKTTRMKRHCPSSSSSSSSSLLVGKNHDGDMTMCDCRAAGHDGLEFVARIPWIPQTTGFYLRASSIATTCRSSTHMFVLFFHKQQSLENDPIPIDGKVFTAKERDFWEIGKHLVVEEPYKYGTCFLYYVPGPTTVEMKLLSLEVKLEFAQDDVNNRVLCTWMERLLFPTWDSRLPLYQGLLPVVLFRDVALTLLLEEPNKQQYMTLKEVLDTNQVDTTPDGLGAIVDVCNVMLEE